MDDATTTTARDDGAAGDAEPVGLPPLENASPPAPTPADLWRARALNLVGLVAPAANLGMVLVAPRDVRWFGLGAGVVCAGVFLWAGHAEHERLRLAALGAYAALVLAGLLHPLWPARIGRAWNAFGAVLGKVMAYPIFGAIWFLVVTPTALLVRAFGKDPLRRRAPPQESYWTPHEPPSKDRYERQF